MGSEQKIAIIGASCYFPDAPDLASFYRNIQAGGVHTSDFPIDQRWGPNVYAADAEQSLQGTYCNQGGVINYDIDFDPAEYKLPPNELLELDPDQLMSINLTRSALLDAGVDLNLQTLNPISCGVILGKVAHVGTASARLLDVVRFLPQAKALLKEIMPDMDDASLATFEQRFLEQRNDFAGTRGISVMSNLLSSRVSERLNLNGPSYIVDGACASSLIAVQQAMRELRLGNAEMMAAGGLLFPIMSGFWKGFSYLGGLSRKGSISAFDQKADGILLGEGGGVVILKCLDKALADGDRIYAVLESLECNNDGRGTGILAPSQSGQVQVLQQTWSKTDISPSQLSYIECHGTGMPLGDKTELSSMTEAFAAALGDKQVTIGSVKSQIGHTLSAAGVASLIKSALCLYHRQIPPTSNCDEPSDLLADKPFKVAQSSETIPGDDTLYAAVNAFGFGGVNSHAILSSYHHANEATSAQSSPAVGMKNEASVRHINDHQPDLMIACESKEALLACLDQPLTSLQARPAPQGQYRLVMQDYNEVAIKYAKKVIAADKRSAGTQGVFYSAKPHFIHHPNSKLALVFPGISYFEPDYQSVVDLYQIDIQEFINRAEDQADAGLEARGSNSMILSYILSQVLQKEHVNIDAVTGFSLGEFSAFIAAGVIDATQLNQFLDDMLHQDDSLSLVNDDYLMLSVSGVNKTLLTQVLAGIDNTYIALVNSSHNIIISTHKDCKEQVTQRFKEHKILFFDIGINAVSHTILNKPILDALRPSIDAMTLNKPTFDVWSSLHGRPCEQTEQAMRDIIYQNLFTQVDFEQLINNMHHDGYGAFIQCGMGGASGYIKETLAGKDVLTVDLVNNNLTLEASILQGLNQLWIEGYDLAASQPVLEREKHRKLSPVSIKLNDLVGEYFPVAPLAEGFEARATQASATSLTDNVNHPGLSDSLKTLLAAGNQHFQEAQNEVMDAFLANSTAQTVMATSSTVTPIMQAPKTELSATQAVSPAPLIHHEAEEAFNFERFPEFRDHEILKHPDELKEFYRSGVVPLSCMILRACQVVNDLFPNKQIAAVKQMTAKKFISLKEPTTVKAEYLQLDANTISVTWHEHFECQVVLTDSVVKKDYDASKWKVHAPSKAESYTHYTDGMLFHGPKFQGLTHIVGNTDNDELVANVINPGGFSAQLDSCFQISACWYDEFSGDTSSLILPLSIELIEFACDSREFIDGQIVQGHCVIFNTNLGDMFFTWDADYYNDEGLIFKIRGFKDFKFESSPALQGLYEAPQKLASSLVTRLDDHVYIYQSEVSTTWSWDLLRSSYLSNDENAHLDTIRFYPEKTAYICGRVAAKDAYRLSHGLDNMHMASINIHHDTSGAPQFEASADGKPCPKVSLAHKQRIGVAALVDDYDTLIGIDVEAISAAKKLDTPLVFSDAERTLCDASETADILKTIIWTAKEAYIKSCADRYRQFATRFNQLNVSDIKTSTQPFDIDAVQTVYVGQINQHTQFTAILWNGEYIITWIKEQDA